MAKKIKSYKEVDLVRLFALQRLVGNQAHPLLQEWMSSYNKVLWYKNFINHCNLTIFYT